MKYKVLLISGTKDSFNDKESSNLHVDEGRYSQFLIDKVLVNNVEKCIPGFRKNSYTYNPVVKIHFCTSKRSIRLRVMSGNAVGVKENQFAIHVRIASALDIKNGEEVDVRFTKASAFLFYWKNPVDDKRFAIKAAVVGLLLSSIVTFLASMLCV